MNINDISYQYYVYNLSDYSDKKVLYNFDDISATGSIVFNLNTFDKELYMDYIFEILNTDLIDISRMFACKKEYKGNNAYICGPSCTGRLYAVPKSFIKLPILHKGFSRLITLRDSYNYTFKSIKI